MIQHFAAIFRNQYQILNPYPQILLRQIDARFHREALAHFDDILVHGRYIWKFMIFQADGMACPVGKVFSISFFFYIIPGRQIDRPYLALL